MNQDQSKIPQATAKRLPLYYRFLQNLHASGKQRVSSQELSEAVKVDSATIRRDFSYFGALGKKVMDIMSIICYHFLERRLTKMS